MGTPVNSFAPAVLGAQATSATSTGSWLNTIGTGLNAVSNTIAGAYQSRVASNNSKLAMADEQNALAAGRFNESKSLAATGQTVAAEKAGQAANNLDVNTGSTVAVRNSTQKVGDMDAALIRYNAAREAYGYGVQASNEKAKSSLIGLGTGFGIAKGAADTYSSYIAGSTALSNQRLGFGQAGVP